MAFYFIPNNGPYISTNYKINDIVYDISRNRMSIVIEHKEFSDGKAFKELLPCDGRYVYYINSYINYENIIKNIKYVSDIDLLRGNKNLMLSENQFQTLKLIKEMI